MGKRANGPRKDVLVCLSLESLISVTIFLVCWMLNAYLCEWPCARSPFMARRPKVFDVPYQIFNCAAFLILPYLKVVEVSRSENMKLTFPR